MQVIAQHLPFALRCGARMGVHRNCLPRCGMLEEQIQREKTRDRLDRGIQSKGRHCVCGRMLWREYLSRSLYFCYIEGGRRERSTKKVSWQIQPHDDSCSKVQN